MTIQKSALRALERMLAVAAVAALASACGNYGGGGSGGGDGTAAANDAFASVAQATPDQVTAFSTTVHPILRTNCATCHAGAGPGTPHIAHPDPAVAYRAVVDNQKVDFASPDRSRLVRRLVADSHYCWSDCAANGAEMQAAIQAWADAIRTTGGGAGGTQVPSITSSALRLDQGTEDGGASRYGGGLIALWEFKEGAGSIAHDTSGVAPAVDLTVSGNVAWMPNYGLDFDRGKAQAPATTSRKLFDHIGNASGGTQQYSLETWVYPENTDQAGPARILSYSAGTGLRNFTLGQVQYSYDFRNRSLAPGVDTNGAPTLETDQDARHLQDNLQHVVVTYDQYRGRRVYVNGVYTGDADGVQPSRLWNWDPALNVVLGNETSNDRRWRGRIRLAAVYEYALTDAQILQNYQAGVGKRLALHFDISPFIGATSWIEFEVTEFDNASYLFCRPTIVNAQGARVTDLRIAVNGQIPVSGQAFSNLDTIVASSRQELSPQCSVIAKDQGSAADLFTLELAYLGNYANPSTPVAPPPLVIPIATGPSPDEGLRNFARVRETLSEVTGVDANTSNVLSAYQQLEQALPSDPDLRTFASSQQMAISNLALEYCDTLVETPALRDAFFGTSPAFEFDQPVSVAFSDATKRDVIFDALYRNGLGLSLAGQPTKAELVSVLDPLVNTLTAACTPVTCDAMRTRTVVKAACTATLSSAAMTIH